MSVLFEIAERIVSVASEIVPGKPFREYQRQFAMAFVIAVLFRMPIEVSALFARQSGKTETIARVIATLMLLLPALSKDFEELEAFRGGFNAGIFAPIKNQAQIAFQRAVTAFTSPLYLAIMADLSIVFVTRNALKRKLSNGSSLEAYSATPTSNIEGATLHLAVCEEAQDIGYLKVNKSIAPMLSSTQGLMVFIGTANTVLSPFHDAIRTNQKLDREGNQKIQRHYQYTWETIVKVDKSYAIYLSQKIADKGTGWVETDAFKMAYNCQFILERGQFISFERFLELEDLCKSIPIGPYDAQGYYMGEERVYFGIDWGKAIDSTVVTAIGRHANRCQVIGWLSLTGDNYVAQLSHIVRFIKRFKRGRAILAEVNSVGDPMIDFLSDALRDAKIGIKVVPFWTSASNKSDGYKSLMNNLVGANRLLFPADPAAQKTLEYQNFADQLISLEKQYKGSALQCCHPEKEDAHDDYPDSLMLANYAATELTTEDLLEAFYSANQRSK